MARPSRREAAENDAFAFMTEAAQVLYGRAKTRSKLSTYKSRVRSLVASGELPVAKVVNGKQLFDRADLIRLRDKFAGPLRGLAKAHGDEPPAVAAPTLADFDEGRALREASAELERQRAEQIRAMKRSG